MRKMKTEVSPVPWVPRGHLSSSTCRDLSALQNAEWTEQPVLSKEAWTDGQTDSRAPGGDMPTAVAHPVGPVVTGHELTSSSRGA